MPTVGKTKKHVLPPGAKVIQRPGKARKTKGAGMVVSVYRSVLGSTPDLPSLRGPGRPPRPRGDGMKRQTFWVSEEQLERVRVRYGVKSAQDAVTKMLEEAANDAEFYAAAAAMSGADPDFPRNADTSYNGDGTLVSDVGRR